MSRAQQVADNVWFVLVARGAMILTPIAMSVIGYLGMNLIDERFSSISQRVDAIEIQSLPARLSVLESKVTIASANRDRQIDDINKRIDSNQNSVDAKLDKLVDGMTSLSNEVAGLAATLRARP